MKIAVFEIKDERMTLTLDSKAYFKTFSPYGTFIGIIMDLESEGFDIHSKGFIFDGVEKMVVR